MFKEGYSNNNKENIPQRIKKLSILGSALAVSLAGNLAEKKWLDSYYNPETTESADKNIYLREELLDVEEQSNIGGSTEYIINHDKSVFIEIPPYRFVSKIEKQLSKENSLYGPESKNVHRVTPKSSECYRAPHIPYRHNVDRPGFPDVKPFGRETVYGNESMSWRYIEALKYKVLTSAVERRYNLPPNLIMAMMIQESGAKEFLPNESGDGGFGLAHMQGETAARFGLHTECHSLVCNGTKRSCKDIDGNYLNHGKTIKEKIDLEKEKALNERYDFRETLSKEDERLNHLANIDTVGRILFKSIMDWVPNNKRTGIKDIDDSPLKSAICVYTGTVNFKKYWKNICTYVPELDDMNKLEKEWNKKEKSNTSLESYLYSMQHYNAANYCVVEYVKELPCYNSRNSEKVLKEYKHILPHHKETFFEIKSK